MENMEVIIIIYLIGVVYGLLTAEGADKGKTFAWPIVIVTKIVNFIRGK
ncbi:MAG: hypothetical protein LBQ89_02250 [Treponema sp.]|nr:hypothetical protein [Treponema sp.]